MATNVSSRSRLKILTSSLGFVSAGEANVSVSGGERLGLEHLRLVPISGFIPQRTHMIMKRVSLDVRHCSIYTICTQLMAPSSEYEYELKFKMLQSADHY